MLGKILIGVAGVLVLFVAVVATRPSAYHVERKLEVAAPADLVFGVLNDLHQFAGVWVLIGSPLETRDPNMDGNHNFVGKAFGMFMNMDNMLGTDLEKGLAQLKIVAEGKQGAR